MSLTIISTKPARSTLKSIHNFIKQKVGVKSADVFLAEVDKITALISVQAFMYKALTIDENVRVAFITKQCSLIYRVTDTEIHLLYFWDNRQDPLFIL
jgi:hypothetical protein